MASGGGGQEQQSERSASPVIMGEFHPFKFRSNSMINYLSPRTQSPLIPPDLIDSPCLALLLEPRSPRGQMPLRRHSESPSLSGFQEIPLNSTPMSSELQVNLDNLPNRSASPISRNSIASSSGFFCRICHEGEERETLLSPCRCAGSIGLVHRSCIERWLRTKHSACCEICNFKFCVSVKSPPLRNWFKNPTRPSDRCNMIGDLVCFILLTPLAAVSVWLCSSGALHYMSSSKEERWEVVGLGCLSACLILIYCVWCFVALRFHIRVFLDWRRTNCIVRVISMPNHYAKVDEIVIDDNSYVQHQVHPASLSFDRTRHTSVSPLLEIPHRYSVIRSSPIPENINEENEEESEEMPTNERRLDDTQDSLLSETCDTAL